jgi:hypothetical protein
MRVQNPLPESVLESGGFVSRNALKKRANAGLNPAVLWLRVTFVSTSSGNVA